MKKLIIIVLILLSSNIFAREERGNFRGRDMRGGRNMRET